jgi:hypothetical protein
VLLFGRAGDQESRMFAHRTAPIDPILAPWNIAGVGVLANTVRLSSASTPPIASRSRRPDSGGCARPGCPVDISIVQ